MINLGSNPGRDMPPVYLKPTLVDLILEGMSALLLMATLVWVIVLYCNSQDSSTNLFLTPIIVMIPSNILLLWAGRAPIRYYNFPVKLNERNYVTQYFIASRYVRIVNLMINIMLSCNLFVGYLFNVKHGLFHLLIPVACGMIFISLIVYYIIAHRYR